MTDFNTTLAALASAANKADKAEAVVAEKTTAHAPFALASMFIDGNSVESWVNAACDATQVKSKKGKRTASALRDAGYNGLYNMAQNLKWIEDNRFREEESETFGNIAVDILVYQFCRIDYNGDVARDFLVSKGELPAVAKQMTAEEAIAAANAHSAGERLAHSADYHKAINAPATFAAMVKEAKQACKVETTFADRMEKLAKQIGEMELADIKANGDALLALKLAINEAQAKVAMAAEIDAAELANAA